MNGIASLRRPLRRIAAMFCIGICSGLFPVLAFAAEVTIDDSIYDATDNYTTSPNVVFISDQVGYAFYVDGSSDVVYKKTTDGGANWGSPVTLSPDKTWMTVSIWYDQWTPGDTTGTKIHIAAAETATDDTWYHYLDTSDDSLRAGGWVDVDTVAGTLIPPMGPPSIIQSTDGYLFLVGVNSGAGFQHAYKSVDGGDTWSSAAVTLTSGHYYDSTQLLPLSDGDVLLIYQDYSVGLYYYIYDEDTDGWGSRQTLDTTGVTAAQTETPTFGGAVYKATNDVYVAATTDPNGTNADIRAYKFTDSSRTWSTLTDILTNSPTGEIGQAVMMIDDNNGDLYAAYVDGTSYTVTMNVYYTKSTDDGSSWDTPVQLNSTTDDIRWLSGNAVSDERMYVTWLNDDLNYILGNTVADLTPSAGSNHTNTISGTVYTDEGVTTMGAGRTIGVAVNGIKSAASGSTDGSGQFTINDIPSVVTGAVLTFFLDDAAERGATVTITDGTNLTGMDLYEDHLIIRSDSGAVAMNNELLANGDSGDTDITNIFYARSEDNTLHVKPGALTTFIPSGETFLPGGRINLRDLTIEGDLDMEENTLSLSGSLLATSGTLSTSSLILTPTSDTISLLEPGSNTLEHVQIIDLDSFTETPTQDASYGITVNSSASGLNYGVRFSPNVDGEVTSLWANCTSMTRTLHLYSCDDAGCTTGTSMVDDSITTVGVGTWVEYPLHPPLRLSASTDYVLSLYNPSAGFCYTGKSTPFTAGNLEFVEARTNNSNAFPASALNSYLYGLVDVSFLPDTYATEIGTVALGSDIAMSGSMVAYGPLSSGNGYSITMSGSWLTQFAGSFISTGSVVLNGTQQTLSGATTFYNLTKFVSSPDTLYFDYSYPQAVSGALVLQGAGSNLLSLRTHLDGTAAALSLDSNGTQSLQYLDVQDNDASGGATLTCSTTHGCVNNGNNTNWNFDAIDTPSVPLVQFFFFGF